MRIIGNDPDVPRQTQGVASGALANGKPVVVNSDGTLSIAGTVAQNLGSGNTFESGQTWEHASAYDSYNKRVVIIYQDNDNSKLLTAVVGAVSGNSISFGTPVVVKSDEENEYGSIVFDSTNNKIVVVYRDDNASSSTYYGAARVGTVDPSDNSISFGTKVVFNSSSTNYISSCFDSTNGKVVIFWRNQGIVGTVSGTSISFGSATTFGSNNNTTDTAAVHDTTNNKIILAYNDTTPSNDPAYCVVATISGTSISFGTSAVFAENGTYPASNFSVVHDSGNNRFVVTAKFQGGLYASNMIIAVGTVSGTSITFGTKQNWTTGSGSDHSSESGSSPSAVYDPAAGKVVLTYYRSKSSKSYLNIATVDPSDNSVTLDYSFDTSSNFGLSINGSNNSYVHRFGRQTVYDSDNKVVIIPFRDSSDNDYGKALVFTNARATITSENYIGVSRSGAADGGTVLVNTQGAIADVPQVFYDIANASYENKSFAAGGGSYGAFIRSDGLKLYTSSFGVNGNIYEYTLSSANDVSSASLANTKATNSDLSVYAAGVFFKTDGTAMFVSDYLNGRVGQYTLSSAWDVSSASFSSSDTLDTSSQNAYPRTVFFKPDGLTLFLLGDDEVVYQYTLSSAWDLSSASYASKSFSITSQESTGYGIWFNNTGTKMYYTGGGNVLYQYSLGTAYDIATASYDSVSFDHSATGGTAYGIIFSDDGSKMIRVSSSSSTLFQYDTKFSLTAGQSYFVQTDGTIGTTAASPSVFAGTAVSATKLIVKG